MQFQHFPSIFVYIFIISVCESHMSVLNFEPCPTWYIVKQMLYIIGGPVIHMFYLTKCTTTMSNEVTCNKYMFISTVHQLSDVLTKSRILIGQQPLSDIHLHISIANACLSKHSRRLLPLSLKLQKPKIPDDYAKAKSLCSLVNNGFE